MIYKVYSVYDSKIESYMQPIFVQTKGQMMRLFTDALADKSHIFAKHPEDYVLFEIGEWDDSKGCFNSLDVNISIGSGLEFSSK